MTLQCTLQSTYDHSFLNFLRCKSQPRRMKQTLKISFLEKLEIES